MVKLRSFWRCWHAEEMAEVVIRNSLKVDFASIPALAAGIRFAHIDGGHLKDVVLNDLHKTEALLAPGGLIVIDDFMHSGFLGVNEACNHYLAEARGEQPSPIAAGKNKLVLADRLYANRYKAALTSTLRPPFGRTVDFHGQSLNVSMLIEGRIWRVTIPPTSASRACPQ